MSDLDRFIGQFAEWSRVQQAFWEAAATQSAFGNASAFVPPDWPVLDDIFDHLLAGLEVTEEAAVDPGWIRVLKAVQAMRGLIASTWAEVRDEFEAHRIAMIAPGGAPPEWRMFRDRWFDIAEAAFIRMQRTQSFCKAQRDVLIAFCDWYAGQPEAVRTAVQSSRAAGKAAAAAALKLFEVPVAQTPKSRIWQGGKATVSRYHPLRPSEQGSDPVLICYGLIGRQTMTDLVPQRSLIRNLLARGVDVFVVDWGNADADDAGNDLAHYAIDVLGKCIDAVQTEAGNRNITLMGICQGGTLAACYSALRPDGIGGLICAGTPVDFHADDQDADPAHGLLNLWVRALSTRDVEKLIALEGHLSGDLLGAIFNQLNPIRTLARYAVDAPEMIGDPGALNTFMAMETWLADRPDLPARMARTWLTDLYHRNALCEGNLVLNGEPVDLAAIRAPVLNIIASGDHIIPPPCSRALSRFVAADKYTELAIPAGHIGTFVGSQAQTLTAPGIVHWLRNNT